MPSDPENILVIRLGALGDLVFCFRAFFEIRQAYPNARIALLTRAPFADFARSLPWFDDVIVETHPTWKTPARWLALRREIANFSPDIVFDLQGKNRQTVLFALLGGPSGPIWSGAAPMCQKPRPWPPTPGMHFTDFLAAQLRAAGVPSLFHPDLEWLDAPVDKFGLPERFAVFVPGCSPNALYKRWPSAKYASLARTLFDNGVDVVAVGTRDDAQAIADIRTSAPDVIDLSGKTNLFELAGIFRRATVVVGNDTGPVHMAAAVHAPTIALFSGRSNPVWSRPLGPRIAWKQKSNLDYLGVGEVVAAIQELYR